MLLEITTTGKWVLAVVAGLFIAWALVTAIFIPRRNPGFPLNLGAYITLSAVMFVAQMAAVYWVATYQEVEHEAAPTETTPTETTPTETTPAETTPAETTPAETTPAETTPAETTPAETTPAETTPAETTPTETTPAETTPTETTPGGEGDAAAGKEVFASAGCGSCHTLADAGASGSVGPNLDSVKPPYDLVVDRVTNGRGAMPSFKGQLDEQQIKDVAAYVSSAAGS